MKKVILLAMAVSFVCFTNAQVFIENFATATINGNLEGYNDWYVSPKSSEAYGVSPKIGEGALFYTGYIGSNIGNVAVLDSAIGSTSATQRMSTKRIIFGSNDTLKVIATGAIYSALMVNINPVSYRSYRDFFTWEGSEGSSFTRGRVFAKNNTEGTEVLFSISKNSSSTADLDAKSSSTLGLTLSTGVNHLLVIKYEIVDGASNDIITLYINPDFTKTEAEQTNKLSTSDVQTDYSTGTPMKINLRQRGIGGQVGGIRVAKTWTEVLGLSTGFENLRLTESIKVAGKTIITENAGNIRIYSLAGSEVLSAATEGQLDTNLPKGMYMIKFVDKSGITSSIKASIN